MVLDYLAPEALCRHPKIPPLDCALLDSRTKNWRSMHRHAPKAHKAEGLREKTPEEGQREKLGRAHIWSSLSALLLSLLIGALAVLVNLPFYVSRSRRAQTRLMD